MLFSPPPTPPVDLTVVGEHRDNPDALLLLGEDGSYYAFSPASDALSPVEPDEQWDVQVAPDELVEPLS